MIEHELYFNTDLLQRYKQEYSADLSKNIIATAS